MQFEGSFYHIERIAQTPTGYEIEVELAADHPIYAGHFPAQPVVPGVCSLTIIRECLRKILGKPIVFHRIKECKFVAALIPCEGLRLMLKIELGDAGRLRCTLSRETQTVLKLNAEL